MASKLTTYNHYKPIALAGLFGWLRRKINAVASFVAEHSFGIIKSMAQTLVDFTDGDGSFAGVSFGSMLPSNELWDSARTLSTTEISLTKDVVSSVNDVELSTEEEIVLDSWSDKKMLPFFKEKMLRIEELAKKASKLDEFISVYNDTQAFISLLKYIASNKSINHTTAYFTPNMIQARSVFLNELIIVLETQIKEYLTLLGVDDTNIIETDIVLDGDYYGEKLGVDLGPKLNLTAKQLFKKGFQDTTGTGSEDIIEEDIIEEEEMPADDAEIYIPPVIENNTTNYGKIALWLLAGIAISKMFKK